MQIDYVTAENEAAKRWIVVDIETSGREDVDHLLDKPEAPKNIKDPVKIQEAIAEKERKQKEEKALDICLNRIVVISYWHFTNENGNVMICRNEDEEREALNHVWSIIRPFRVAAVPIVGFRCKGFDIPTMLQRMRLLNMPMPNYDYSKWSKGTIDIADILAFGDAKWEPGAQIMRRRLKDYCRLFDIPVVDDDCNGSDVPELIKQGRYEEVIHHCEQDVERTMLLAKRVGAIA